MNCKISTIKKRVAKSCFFFARSKIGGTIVGWVFAKMSNFLPVNRLYDTENVTAFYHPRPMHPVHILIVPKHIIGSFTGIKQTEMPIIAEVLTVAQHLVHELGLEDKGYRLMVNGGIYQDVKQLHFHLISGPQRSSE